MKKTTKKSATRYSKPKVSGLRKLLIVLGLVVMFIAAFGITMQLSNGFTLGSRAAMKKVKIDPRNFTTKITNKYMSLPIGSRFIFEGETADGLERIEITVGGQTKKLMGVTTLVYRDKVYLDDQMVEDTRDYLAQDREGNVWYFGEEVNNYENGVLVDHDGTWLAGVDGAKPGILIKQNPRIRETYQQEFYEGVAEDTVDVLSLTETVTGPLGMFKNCLKTYDYTPLDPDSKEHKFFCPAQEGLAVGHRVLITHLINKTKMELVEVKAKRSGGGKSDDSNDDDDKQTPRTP